MNKTLLKASSLTAIVLGLINIFVFIGVHFVVSYFYFGDNIYSYIILLFIAICSFISVFGGFIFLKYKDLSPKEIKSKEKNILIWSIYFTIATPVAGVLGLVSYFMINNEYNSKVEIKYIEEIKELEELRKEGYITDKEFEKKKKKLLDI